MRHNRLVPIQHWRAPVALRVMAAVQGTAGVLVAAVFFPPWFGIPVAVLAGVWYLGAAILGGRVTVDTEAGLLRVRLGVVVRRIRLADVTAVLVDDSKVSIARANGGEISLFAWRTGRLARWLRVPATAADIGHAISAASLRASDKAAQVAPAGRKTPLRSRSAQANALIVGAGVVALVAAFLVRLHWHNPVMTTLAIALAASLGVAGVYCLLMSLVLLLLRRYPLKGANAA